MLLLCRIVGVASPDPPRAVALGGVGSGTPGTKATAPPAILDALTNTLDLLLWIAPVLTLPCGDRSLDRSFLSTGSAVFWVCASK